MANRNTTVTPAPRSGALPVPQADDGNPSGLEILDSAELEQDIKRVAAELGESETEAKVQIWRIRKGERRPAFVATVPPQSFSMEKIAEDFGGGMYNIKVFVPRFDAEGRRAGVMLAKNPIIEIDGLPKEPKRPDPAPVTIEHRQSEVSALAVAIAQGFEKLGSLMIQNAPKPQSLAEAVRDLTALQTLMNATAPKNDKQIDPFVLFERFMGIQEKMTSAVDRLPGNASNNQLMLALGRDFLEVFKKGSAGAPALPQPAAPDPGAEPVVEQPPAAPAANEDEPMSLIFRGYVKMLVESARANNDVDPIAQMIYDQAPDELLAQLIRDEKYIEQLAVFNSNVKLYPAWFDKLRARIKEIYEADQNANQAG